MENLDNPMKSKLIISIFVLSALAACGPGPQTSTAEKPANAAATPAVALPTYDSTGVISAVNGLTLTLDHDGASAAGVPAGSNDFQTYADVLADAPLTPGGRVAFKFRKADNGLQLVELKPR